MKRFRFFIPLVPLFLITLSCDKVDNPIQSPQNLDNTTYVRKALLEDYTGHTCGNCPAAAEVAENLAKQYGDKVVVIAVHAGWFTKLELPDYNTSYTTTVGNDWDASTGFGVSAMGNPNGMVNRKSYGGSSIIQKETKWPTSVSLALADTYILGLKLSLSYNASTRKLNTNVKANFKTGYGNTVKVNVLLVEDSIIGDQKDYSQSPAHVSDYVFMHMLRAGINGSWGSTLKETPIAAKDSVSLDFPDFAVSPNFKEKNLSVVAFAYDAATKEVLQVEKVHLIAGSSSH